MQVICERLDALQGTHPCSVIKVEQVLHLIYEKLYGWGRNGQVNLLACVLTAEAGRLPSLGVTTVAAPPIGLLEDHLVALVVAALEAV